MTSALHPSEKLKPKIFKTLLGYALHLENVPDGLNYRLGQEHFATRQNINIHNESTRFVNFHKEIEMKSYIEIWIKIKELKKYVIKLELTLNECMI